MADRFFNRWGPIAILVGRMLPIIRTFIAFPAGVARMPLIPFHIYTFVGSWPFCLALAWIGMKLGNAWNSDPRLKAFFHQADLAIGAVIVIAGGLYLWHRLRGLKKRA